jgi:hypothetical protein
MVRRALPNYLWLVLAILFVQIILNVFGGTVLLYALGGQPDAGLLYVVVCFALLASVVLAVSALFLVLRNPWARYPVIVVEGLSMAGGLMSLLTGATAGITNLALGFAVIVMLHQPEVRAWLTDVRTPPAQWHGPIATPMGPAASGQLHHRNVTD